VHAHLNHETGHPCDAFQRRIFYLFFPSFKPSLRVLVQLGLLLVLSADTLRKAAMLYVFSRVSHAHAALIHVACRQAGRSFTHLIARHKVEGHVLVTSGGCALPLSSFLCFCFCLCFGSCL
jgi:hypothetical protein